MKLFVKAITSIILFITSLLFCLSITTNKIVKEDISSLLANKLNINEQLNKVLSSFGPLLKQDISNIIDQNKTNELVLKYTPIILQDLAGDESHKNYDMDTDLQNVLLENMDAFKSVMKNSLTDAQKEEIITAAIQAIDMQTIYDNVIDTARSRLSNQELCIIQVASFLTNTSTIISSGLLTLVITAGLCIIEYRKRQYSYVVSVSFLSSALIILLMYLASKKILILQTIDFSLLLMFSIGYVGIALILFFVTKHLKSISTS